ncbi:MAG: YaiI/YqxD family protein [Alphaproteobacteria bacterium]|nr:YaiI/YqxD family protein [Alphaproteobacteria bacterium]
MAETPIRIFVDGDACPVKDETYRVGERHGVPVIVVSNSYLRIPRSRLVSQVVVEKDPDAADDHIAANVDLHAIVVTADIPLADRCLTAGARVIAPNGKAFTPDSIGVQMATRALMQDLRSGGDIVGGPPPFDKRDRSRFLEALHEAVIQLQRR